MVSLPIRDLDASLRFYTNVFGLPDLAIDEGIITVDLPGLSLFLIEEEQFESYSQKAGRGVQYAGERVGVILSCAIRSRETLDSMLARVAENGGTVSREPAKDEEMELYIGYFFDPDGHHWEFAYSG